LELSSYPTPGPEQSTVTLLSLAHLMLSRQVSEGVAQAGHPIKASHSAVFGQMSGDGSRLTDLARVANMTPQAMGELVDELEGLGYLARRPDPTDRRAKLITLTESGRQCVAAGIDTIDAIERRIDDVLGERGHRDLRRMLLRLLAQD
jgi:DNA-binding MarR family transcriptional regulator